MNLLEGSLTTCGEQMRFELGDWRIVLNDAMRSRLWPYVGQTVTLGLRPGDLTPAPASTASDSSPAIVLSVTDLEFRGGHSLIRGAIRSGATLVALIDHPVSVLAGEAIRLYARIDRACFFSPGIDGRNLLES
jgi:hypothetical protein